MCGSKSFYVNRTSHDGIVVALRHAVCPRQRGKCTIDKRVMILTEKKNAETKKSTESSVNPVVFS